MEKPKCIMFQQFNLDTGRMPEVIQQVNTYPRWRKVKRILQARGFTLLCNQSEVGGVPTVVIVGIPADCLPQVMINDHFYKLAAECGLPFLAGEWYVEEVWRKIPEDLFADENYQAFVTLTIDDQWFKDHLGMFVGFVDGNLVVQGIDQAVVTKQLRDQYPNKSKFLTRVVMEGQAEEVVPA